MDNDGSSSHSDEYIAWCHTRYLNPASHIARDIYERSKADEAQGRADRALATTQ